MLARGGALSPYSGLGSTHTATVERLENSSVKGYSLNGVYEYKIRNNPLSKVWKRWFSAPKEVAKMAAKNDIIHITDQEQAGLCPVNQKSVITIHDLFHLFPTTKEGVQIGNPNPSFFRKKDLNKVKRGIERADLLICVSKHTQQECEMRFPGIKSKYIPHAIDLEKYSIKTERPDYFSDGKNLLIIGSEEDRKRLDFAVKVCSGLDVTLHKIGAESSEKAKLQLQNLAKESGCNLNWVGRLENSEMIAALQHADCLLFPSIAEGFGLPPLEAYASGTVALVADYPAHNEICLPHHLLDPNDTEAWQKAIKELDDESEAVRQRAEFFSIDKWCERIKDAYDSLF